MLERPDLPDQIIKSRLEAEYGLQVGRVKFLPLGADVNTAVYRVDTEDGSTWFLKLRSGSFDEMTVAVPRFLHAQGIPAIIAPLETRDRQPWGSLEDYKMILYPFIQGRNGYEVPLTGRQWFDLGAALKGVHTAQVPLTLTRRIQRETFSPQWRESVRAFQAQVEKAAFDDPVAAKLARFMQARRDEISHMVRRAEQLALALQARPLEFVLCHSDLHPGNLLIGDSLVPGADVPGADVQSAIARGADSQSADAQGALYIVDWDNPSFAPKERDLMFIDAGMGSHRPGGREKALFYEGYNRGYGQAEVDPTALAYYRYERIIQDIAAFCEQLFLTTEGGEDREQSYRYFTGQFLPGHEVDIACKDI